VKVTRWERALSKSPRPRRRGADFAGSRPDEWSRKKTFGGGYNVDIKSDNPASALRVKMPDPAKQFGQFKILAELGRGTTGIVYEVKDPLLDRRLALKILRIAAGADRNAALRQFMSESRALAYLTGAHPAVNIPMLHMVAECHGQAYYVRDVVDGTTLEQSIADGLIGLPAALRVVLDVARVVDWMHQEQFVHRNVCRENILVASDGTGKLIGFGMVTRLAPVDPDQFPASEANQRIDISALQELVCWMCAALDQRLEGNLVHLTQPGAFWTAGAFAAGLAHYLR
jgi:serine/threonine protein kinase